MKNFDKYYEVIRQLLLVDHNAFANKLGFIDTPLVEINEKLLYEAISALDEMSRSDEDNDKKAVVIMAAILWSYKHPSWNGLREYLTLVLSRSGFSPSSIMIDDTFDFQNGIFSSLDSIFNQIAVTVHQMNTEIFVRDKKYLVTNFQKRIWEKLDSVKLLGISAPTSAGKSFILLLKAIDTILKHQGNVMYIVPTLSLVSQVASDFSVCLKKFDLFDYQISTTFNIGDAHENKIYILTQEKAISAFSQSESPFPNIQMLIVDEIQNIERVASENDQRSKILYDTLIELKHSSKINTIVLSGPRVEGLKELGIDIFEEYQTDVEKTKNSPVVNITYAISKEKKRYYFNQYCDLLKRPNRIEIANSDFIYGHDKVIYNSRYYEYLSTFVGRLGNDARNIIFAPTTDTAKKIAIEITGRKETLQADDRINNLVSYIKETVHVNYDMCQTILAGVAYHHAKIPSHIRIVLERAIRDKLISNTVCTTTLMQGVNLPAQNIIMRNPYLSIQQRDGYRPKLTDYEIANLRGRSGRLLKDFIGRTFVLDENAFDKNKEEMTLFHEVEKILHSGYGEKYSQYKNEITTDLLSNIKEDSSNIGYSFLLTHIRQTILKHKHNSIERLRAVGIIIDNNELQEISRSLVQKLTIPHSICYKNRYWDPLILNDMYEKRDEFTIPKLHNEASVETNLEKTLDKFINDFPFYYERYLKNNTYVKNISIMAKDWMREKSLKDILSTQYHDKSENIDKTIGLLQSEISFGLPMLLKPIYDMKEPDSMFLRFIELGAYRPITRKMIEMNIPRETSIFLSKKYFDGYNNSIDNFEIIKRLREIRPALDYWQQIQIETVL